MADDRPALSLIDQVAQIQRQLDDLQSTALVRAARQPTGTMLATLLATPPADTIFLQGQTVTKVAYPVLWQWASDNTVAGFTVASTTLGLPDLRDVALIGAGATAVTAGRVGAASVVLTVAQLPSHGHSVTVSDHVQHQHNPTSAIQNVNHTHTFTTGGGGDHPNHTPPPGGTVASGSGSPAAYAVYDNSGTHTHGGTTDGISTDHNHPISESNAGPTTHTVGQSNVGGGTAVPILPPSIGVNWMIWT